MLEDKIKGCFVGGLLAIFRLKRKEVAMMKRVVIILKALFYNARRVKRNSNRCGRL